MKVGAFHSHQNGYEWIQHHKPSLWKEILEIIDGVEAGACRTKESKEKRSRGKVFYNPRDLNRCMAEGFTAHDWKEKRTSYWVTDDAGLIRRTINLPRNEQKAEIVAAGRRALSSHNQTDFVKERVAVEVQFGKYAFVAYDLFVKHMAFFIGDVIDLGIEILAMKELQSEMSSGVGYYEGELYNLIREGRGVPAVPLVLIGVVP